MPEVMGARLGAIQKLLLRLKSQEPDLNGFYPLPPPLLFWPRGTGA